MRGELFHADGQTEGRIDRQTDRTKLTVAFRNFVNWRNKLNTFYSHYQLTHTTLKNVELLKHSKIDKNAPTCFGLHGNHLQGAKVSTWLKVTR